MLNHVDITDAKEIEKWLVPMTRARREFGKIVARVQRTGRTVTVVKGGKPVAKVMSVKGEELKMDKPKSKKETKGWLSKYVGSWKGTYLDSDEFWEGILTKDSKPVEETMI